MNNLTIALDAMGGDFGPRVVVPAAIKAIQDNDYLCLLIFGKEDVIKTFFPNDVEFSILSKIQIIDTPNIIDENIEYIHAIKNSADTSMQKAIESVKDGKAVACVSAGNSGVLMGLSKIILGMITGVERPALAAEIPVAGNKKTIMLDLGANLESTETMLYQFTIMGKIFIENYLNITNPSVALLNIGTEKNKGTKLIQKVDEMLAENSRNINYIGYIESNNILSGVANVIVGDGFISNIALKSMEGASKFFLQQINTTMESKGLISRLIRFSINKLYKNMFMNISNFNPDKYNGASLLGLNSVVIKSHAHANVKAFSQAIQAAYIQATKNIPAEIQKSLSEDYDFQENIK